MKPDIALKLAQCRYHGDYIFAFDHYEQKKLIVEGLRVWKTAHPDRPAKFYVLCGFRCEGREVDDILEALKRIRILMQFGMLPYIMRHEEYRKSIFRDLYTQLARWCNQPQFFKKKSFKEFVEANQFYRDKNPNAHVKVCSAKRAMDVFLTSPLRSKDGKTTKEIAKEFFSLKFETLCRCWCSRKELIGEKGL